MRLPKPRLNLVQGLVARHQSVVMAVSDPHLYPLLQDLVKEYKEAVQLVPVAFDRQKPGVYCWKGC